MPAKLTELFMILLVVLVVLLALWYRRHWAGKINELQQIRRPIICHHTIDRKYESAEWIASSRRAPSHQSLAQSNINLKSVGS
jgi:hypothetical protein